MQRHQVEGRKLVSLKQKSNYTTNILKCVLKAKQWKDDGFQHEQGNWLQKNSMFSDWSFYGFCRPHRILLRRKTHTAQKSPAEPKNAIEMFHGKLLWERRRGTFSLADIANMDQTPLPFVMDDGKTYNQTGSKEIWCASGSSGLEKRQCTVQLTIFADGVLR